MREHPGLSVYLHEAYTDHEHDKQNSEKKKIGGTRMDPVVFWYFYYCWYPCIHFVSFQPRRAISGHACCAFCLAGSRWFAT